MKIFIIDDNSLHLKMCRFILEKMKHDVHLFSSLGELKAYSGSEPDIFFIDYRLGVDETGIDVLKYVKETLGWTKTRCVAFTADVSEEAQLKRNDFSGVILKPITEKMLSEAVEKYSR
ncbi:response regulator [Limisalsivibrio acetivorans]|uniref:response regulator n=1 Tax=Limisalsivibrio acetivorans TaxID=1304888 RepID=UPI0003B3A30C|nr:response regulator [Limisalsivibrio acetivorans]